ncbi:MAG TPA: phage tail protein, partial [Bacteroidales bacterium]|nr:phage tail protein [Bacteroidales bacterium]
ELHDHEDAVLTIKKVARTYSPWSSKIYGLRNLSK